MTAQRYVHDILKPHMLPLMQRLLGATFQQDNARPHTARMSQDCLLLPFLSPIEHNWDHLGWRVGHPMSLNELEFHAEIVELEIGGVVIYRNVLLSLREFHQSKSYCHLYGAQGQRQAYF
ncbi:transposable element Tcb2 transposase [Trichonephila clavipes]|nr:transposable element Tcb2 transposase [Trichonephila clavipes]